MKNLFTFLFILCFGYSFAQDTTSWRAVGTTHYNQFSFFKNDSTDLTTTTSTGQYGVAIFMNPADSLLYGVWNLTAGPTRSLYRANPFMGTLTLVHTFTNDHVNTADISADGQTVYASIGNGGTTPGQVIALDMNTLTETPLGVIPGTVHGVSYGVEFHEPDSTLYFFEGNYNTSSNELERFDLATGTTISTPMTGIATDAIKGSMYTGNPGEFLLFNGWAGNQFFQTDATSENASLYYFSSAGVATIDVDIIWTLRREADTIGFCPGAGDSTLISLIYDVPAFSWYKDGVLLSETNDSIWVSAPGTYMALYQINGSSYMWSEPVVIEEYTIPTVNITQTDNDTMLCGTGDFITLTGANPGGGSVQWYLDGSPISGATSGTYDATAPGSYNQMKINSNGCSDTAASAYLIIIDPNCGVGVEEFDDMFRVYPNPVGNVLYIESGNEIQSIVLTNLQGQVVYSESNLGTKNLQISTDDLAAGTYLLKIWSESGIITRMIVK